MSQKDTKVEKQVADATVAEKEASKAPFDKAELVLGVVNQLGKATESLGNGWTNREERKKIEINAKRQQEAENTDLFKDAIKDLPPEKKIEETNQLLNRREHERIELAKQKTKRTISRWIAGAVCVIATVVGGITYAVITKDSKSSN